MLGGSFDPVHLGHIAVADLVYGLIEPDELRFMPCKIAPHKAAFYCEEEHRVAMLELALQNRPYLIDTYELKQATTSYSVQSMKALREKLGAEASIMFVMGYDSLQNLHSWWHWQELFELVNLLIVGRPGSNEPLDEFVANIVENNRCTHENVRQYANGRVLMLPSSNKSISSSGLRKQIAFEKNEFSQVTQNTLDAAVAKYVKKHCLYQG